MADFRIDFTDEEVESFLHRIEVNCSQPSPSFLEAIVSGIIEHIPFQNFSMLTDDWVRPSPHKIKLDMLSGHGGLCTVRNPFLHELLDRLGFSVRFVSSTIMEPDCHISLLVNIDNKDWWVDVGNGFPYLKPIMLGDESEVTHPFIHYRIVNVEDRWHVQHRKPEEDWKTNHHFSDIGVPYSVFDKMHHLHYSTPGWGPFLTGLRVNRWWPEGGVILKDERASSPHGEIILKTPSEITGWLNKWFIKSGFLDSINVAAADLIWRRTSVEFR
jgi:N-hydroxyarylamine O-acetyltransferase